jgi:hypothetical protein
MKSTNNLLGISKKRTSNLSKLRAQEVYYNNTLSGLTGTNVQEAIDELATGSGGTPQATPVLEGKMFGYTREPAGENTTILGYGSIPAPVGVANRSVIGRNSFPNLVDNGSGNLISIGNNNCEIGSTSGLNCTFVGHNNCIRSCGGYNTILGTGNMRNLGGVINTAQNILLGSDILIDNNNSVITNNFLVGSGNLSPTVEPIPSPEVKNNIIIGSEITYDSSKNIEDNIIIGKQIDCNPQKSIIIHGPTGSSLYDKDNDNVFVLSDGNIANYPTSDNQFIIDHSYNDYFIHGITGPYPGAGTELLYYEPTTGQINYGPNSSSSPMTPVSEGVAYGFTQSTDPLVSIGYNSFGTYATAPGIFQIQNLGFNNCNDLDPAVTSTDQITIIGNEIFTSVGPLTSFAGNVIIGNHGLANSSTTDMSNNILIGGGAGPVNVNGILTGPNCTNNIAINTNPIVYGNQMSQGSTILSTASVENMDNNCIYLSAGNVTHDNNNNSGNIVISSGFFPYTASVYSGVCYLGGATSDQPNSNNQLFSDHENIGMPNLTQTAAVGYNQRHLYYDNSSSQILSCDPSSTAMSRVARFTGSTDGSGNVTFDLTSLSLSVSPVVTANAVNGSGTTFHGCRITSVSTTSVTIKVFQSVLAVVGSQTMTPSGSGVTVHCHVAY